MIACFECRNLIEFVQVSERSDVRSVELTVSGGPATGPWDREDDRAPGIYCAKCSQPVEADIEALGLVDSRVAFMAPEDLDLQALTDEVRSVRTDATWGTLRLPAQSARYQSLGTTLSQPVTTALERMDRTRFYTHQAQAIDAAVAGHNVVQATSAGSGKSMGLIVPVLDRLMNDPRSTALLVYPLRALANDQLDALTRFGFRSKWRSESVLELQLTPDSDPIVVGRWDGSTLDSSRMGIRRDARILITTPDSVHASLLHYGLHEYKDRDKTSWSRFLKGLSIVVLDELHVYQGVFGSTVALLLRRLRRMAKLHGATPQFLAASATIGNPVELSQDLTGVEPFHLVDDDGSERAERLVLVCNPPERSASESGDDDDESDDEEPLPIGRIAPQTVAIDVVAKALASDMRPPVRTIVFSRSRNSVFQLNKRIQRELKRHGQSDLVGAVKPYAATFLSDDRQRTEGELRDGTTLAVVSTNALELGIDIPDLSLAVLAGYPGQLSSFRQRAGRVGRRGPGLAVLIVGDDPLQQYIARDPQALQNLLDAPPEEVVVNPNAVNLADRFGLAPAHEEVGGICVEDAEFFGEETVRRWLERADPNSKVVIAGREYLRVDDPGDWPESLRSAGSSASYTVMVRHGRDREPIGVIDESTGPRDAFVPAIWTGPDGDLYEVTDVIHDEKVVICEGPVDVEYQTRGVPVDRVYVLQDHRDRIETRTGSVGYSQLSIERYVVAAKRQYFSGRETGHEIERGWPPVTFVTEGLRIEIDPQWFADDVQRDEAVKALEHVLLSVAPVVVACDPADIESSRDRGTIYVYDSFGGGLRLSEPIFERFDEVVKLAHEVVATCSCESGCPSCVMLSRRPDSNEGLSKAGALRLLEAMTSIR